jgi:Domain of unknown function (DUF222)
MPPPVMGAWPGLADDELIGVLRAWRRLESWSSAGTLAAAAELARRRPAARTPAGRVLAAGPGEFPARLSEFISDEIAAALTVSGPAASVLLGLALDLATRLPGTAGALRGGVIDYPRARLIAEAAQRPLIPPRPLPPPRPAHRPRPARHRRASGAWPPGST